MRGSSRARIVHVIWAIAGIAIGACGAILWMGNFKAPWVEATGTWFGAIATVLALLWAVQTFRTDQAHRETELVARETDRLRDSFERAETKLQAAEQAKMAILDEAKLVTISLLGGAGHGSDPDMQMTSVRVQLRNDTSSSVVVNSFVLTDPLIAKRPVSFPIRLEPNSQSEVGVEVLPINIGSNELSGQPLLRLNASVIYRINSRSWSRGSDEVSAPTLLT